MIRIIIVSLLWLSASCSGPQNKPYFDPPILEKIAQLSSIEPLPAIISFTRIYVRNINDSIAESKIESLNQVYQTSYTPKYSKFSDFLFDALNQKIKIDARDTRTYLYYSQVFAIFPAISRLYNEKRIKGIIEEYCLEENGIYRLKSPNLSLNEINSLSYYFFINQYIRADDDYKGTINFRLLSSVLK